MKQIISTLTISALAATLISAKDIKSNKDSELSYRRIAINYNTGDVAGNTTDNAGVNGYSIDIESLIGSSNFWIGTTFFLDGYGVDYAYLGYRFQNVAFGIDATPYVSSNDYYGIHLRRSLNEILNGLEARVSFEQASGSNRANTYTYELAYNFDNSYQAAVWVYDTQNYGSNVGFSLRYKF